MTSSHAPQTPRVLIVDDEKIVADTLQIILNQNGFEAIAVYDGLSAVSTAAAWKPDILLSDVVMPNLNGVEAAIRVRALVPQCRVLLLSGQTAVEDLLHEAQIRGHNFEVKIKPVHPRDLLHLIRTLS